MEVQRMIKIIKEGTKKQATCDRCGCVFSYEAEDIEHLEYQNEHLEFTQGIKHGFKQYVTCPQCKDKIVVSQTR
jgi:Fe2+ or Zn2+ uptake regulation protein